MTPEEKKAARLKKSRKWHAENKDKDKASCAKWYAANKERHKEACAKYYKANKERLSKINAAWREANKEKQKEYHRKKHIENRARNIARAAAWVAANRERASETNSVIYYRNKESRKITNKAWREANPDRVRELKVKRRAALLSAMPSHTTKSEQFEMRFLYGLRRSLSRGGTEHHVDHIIPLSRGGLHHPSNLRIIPAVANMRKWAKLMPVN